MKFNIFFFVLLGFGWALFASIGFFTFSLATEIDNYALQGLLGILSAVCFLLSAPFLYLAASFAGDVVKHLRGRL